MGICDSRTKSDSEHRRLCLFSFNAGGFVVSVKTKIPLFGCYPKGFLFFLYFCRYENILEKKVKENVRSRIMASVHSSGTKPEMIVRRFLFSRGYRYRLNSPRLPGRPDLVLRKYRTCIFVNGCFWHGHDCKEFRMPKTNTDFWIRKITRNKQRDKEVQKKLAQMGWHCVTVWECELKGESREATLRSLAFTLNHIFLQDRATRYPTLEEDGQVGMAAEPAPDGSVTNGTMRG